MIGSRDAQRSAERVEELRAMFPESLTTLSAGSNEDAAQADIVVMATAADHTVATAEQLGTHLAGRIVVSMANVLRRHPRGFRVEHPTLGSVALELASSLPTAKVVGAFENLPAAALLNLEQKLRADVFVCGDHAEAVHTVMGLIEPIEGLRPIDGGPLANTMAIEALTAVLLTANKNLHGSFSVRLVDLHD
jgi:hypothetical protein